MILLINYLGPPIFDFKMASSQNQEVISCKDLVASGNVVHHSPNDQ